MDETATKPWRCKRCGRQLATVEHDADGRLRLVFESTMLPSLIRDAPGFVDVECPRCGTVRKWYKMLDMPPDS